MIHITMVTTSHKTLWPRVYITVTIATTFVHVHEVSVCVRVLMIHITMVTTSHKYNYIMAHI